MEMIETIYILINHGFSKDEAINLAKNIAKQAYTAELEEGDDNFDEWFNKKIYQSNLY